MQLRTCGWMSLGLIAVLVGAACGQQFGQTEAQREERAKLSGKWTAAEGRRAGESIPQEDLAKYKFWENAIDFPPLRPVLIHWSQSGNVFLFGDGTVGFGGGKMYWGFYEWDGDRLVVCVCTIPKSWLTTFTTSRQEAENGPFVIVTFERAKA